MRRTCAFVLVGLVLTSCGSDASVTESSSVAESSTSRAQSADTTTSTVAPTTSSTTTTTTTTTTTVPSTTTLPPPGEASLGGTWDATLTYPEDANVEEFGGAIRERVWVFEDDCSGDECTTTAIITTALGEFPVDVERNGNAGHMWAVTQPMEPALEGERTVCEWEEMLTYLVTVEEAEMIDGRWSAVAAAGSLEQTVTVVFEAPEVRCETGEPLAAEIEMVRRP